MALDGSPHGRPIRIIPSSTWWGALLSTCVAFGIVLALMHAGVRTTQTRSAETDSDRDGVVDAADLCPGTPPNAIADRSGCPLYSDGDDVPDYLDECPATPAGVFVNADGCPVDGDLDGVPDHLDACPGTPARRPVSEAGCRTHR